MYIFIYISINIYTYIYTNIHYVYMYIYTYVYIYICIYKYMYVNVNVYIYIYTHTHTQLQYRPVLCDACVLQSMLQCVAVIVTVQNCAVCWSVLRCIVFCIAMCCSVRCSALQCVALCVSSNLATMGWLRLVGSIKLISRIDKIEPYKRDHILHKRPMILSILLTVATPWFLQVLRSRGIDLCTVCVGSIKS